ncbi:hypothetical protein [Catenibacterium sp.]|nr:hypothetical protein [Catenibacterium sp.]MEE0820499.1 hypothetical protein [Catenibacterium sp.]
MILSRQQSNEGNIIDADEVLEMIMKNTNFKRTCSFEQILST